MDKKEKERYEWRYSSKIMKHYMFDNLTKTQLKYEDITNLLNQQDKRIKELENMNSRLSQGIYWGNGEQFCDVVKNLKKENQQLKQQVKELEERLAIQLSNNADNVNFMENQRRENEQLKQQLYDLPEKIIGEVENELLTKFSGSKDYGRYIMTKTILDTILKRYENSFKKTP